MNNYIVSAIYANIKLGNETHEYTFFTKNPQKILNKISQHSNCDLFDFQIKVSSIQNMPLGIRKNKTEIQAFEEVFKDKDFVRLDGTVFFEASIDHPSIINEALFRANLYEPKNDFEQLLKRYGVLKSYYYQQVTFEIRHQRDEYSSEFGLREFNNTTDVKRVSMSYFDNEGHSDNHRGDVYSSHTKSRVIRIYGINDKGEKINISPMHHELRGNGYRNNSPLL